MFTGRSGFLVDMLLEGGENEVPRIWLEKQNNNYDDPEGIKSMLDDLGVLSENCKLLIIDDHMQSGRIKARQSLIGLSKSGLKDFGFASLIGPFRYHRDCRLVMNR